MIHRLILLVLAVTGFNLCTASAQQNSWIAQSMHPFTTAMVFSPNRSAVCFYQNLPNNKCDVNIHDTYSRAVSALFLVSGNPTICRISNSSKYLLTVDTAKQVTIYNQLTGEKLNSYIVDNLTKSYITDIKFRDDDSTFTMVRKYLDYYVFVDTWSIHNYLPISSDTLTEFNITERLQLSSSGKLLCYTKDKNIFTYLVPNKKLQTTTSQYTDNSGKIIGYSHDDSMFVYYGKSGITTYAIRSTGIIPVANNSELSGNYAEFNNEKSYIALEGGIYKASLQDNPLFTPEEGEFNSPFTTTSDFFKFCDNNDFWVGANRTTTCQMEFYAKYKINTLGKAFLVYDLNSETLKDQFPCGHGNLKNIISTEFSLNDATLVTTDHTNLSCFWRTSNGAFIREFFAPNVKPYLSSTGAEFYIADSKQIKEYSVEFPTMNWSLNYDELPEIPKVFNTPNKMYILVVSRSKGYCINSESRSIISSFSETINNPSVTSNNTLLFTSGSDIKEFNPSTRVVKTIMSISNETLKPDSVNFSYSGNALVTYTIAWKFTNQSGLNTYLSKVYSIPDAKLLYVDSLINTALVPYLHPDGKYIHFSRSTKINSENNFKGQALTVETSTKHPLCDTNYYGGITSPIVFQAIPSRSAKVISYTFSCGSTIIVSPPPCDAALDVYESPISTTNVNTTPNPYSSTVKITFQLEQPHSFSGEVKLYNIQGEVVFFNNIKVTDASEQQIILNTPTLPQGLYFTEITIGSTIIRGKLMKSNE